MSRTTFFDGYRAENLANGNQSAHQLIKVFFFSPFRCFAILEDKHEAAIKKAKTFIESERGERKTFIAALDGDFMYFSVIGAFVVAFFEGPMRVKTKPSVVREMIACRICSGGSIKSGKEKSKKRFAPKNEKKNRYRGFISLGETTSRRGSFVPLYTISFNRHCLGKLPCENAGLLFTGHLAIVRSNQEEVRRAIKTKKLCWTLNRKC